MAVNTDYTSDCDCKEWPLWLFLHTWSKDREAVGGKLVFLLNHS